ncbi:MAG: holo-ACP synthase [Gammaproteobacteria bacterium]|nr:holo-ACP synthase [Gammaproteobacteria bacterium]
MIRGLGIDLVEMSRVAAAYQRFGDRFARKVLTPEELAWLPRVTAPARFIAMRFAVKEACSKALGTGFRQGVAPRQIGVVQERSGKPNLVLHGNAQDHARRMGISGSHVSMTDEGGYAAAVVVLESD